MSISVSPIYTKITTKWQDDIMTPYGIQTQFENAEFVQSLPLALGLYCEFKIKQFSHKQKTFGKYPMFRLKGEIEITVHAELKAGELNTTKLLDYINAETAFGNVAVDGIRYRAAVPDPGARRGSTWDTVFRIRFQADHHKGA